MWCFSLELFNRLVKTKTKFDFQLTCKYLITDDMFITGLIVVILEEQYSTERNLWLTAFNKTKQRLLMID